MAGSPKELTAVGNSFEIGGAIKNRKIFRKKVSIVETFQFSYNLKDERKEVTSLFCMTTLHVHVVLFSLLADQLSGQFLIIFGRPKQIDLLRGVHVVLVSLFGRPNVLSISHFLVSQKKIVSSQRPDNFFCPLI